MLEHGGNLAQAAKQYGIALTDWLDLSTGINPNQYPIPAIPSRIWQRLPDANDELIEAALAYYGCQSLLPTAGSQAAIQILPKLRPAGHIAMPSMMYQEHSYAWKNNGHQVTLFETSPDDSTLNQADVVLLCNPNNPTGKRYQKKQLLHWHQQLAARGAWLIVDEAFMDMTPNESLAEHAHQECLIVLRSLGKFFGLAGARVGFLLAHHHILNLAQEMLGPWTITGPSEFIATQALLNQPWQEDTRKALATNSLKLQKLLSLYDLQPTGKTDLFQFVTSESAMSIHHALAKQGVWTRLFDNIPAVRFGLPPGTQWQQLEAALNRIS